MNMKKTRKILSIAVLSCMIATLFCQKDSSAAGYDSCVGKGINYSIKCQKSDVITVTCSDNCGVTCEYTGESSISIGGFTSCSKGYDVIFVKGGTHTFTFLNNGKEIGSKTVNIADSHSYEKEVKEKETCEKDGKVTYTCSICKDEYSETIPKTGHNFVDTKTDATCETDGKIISKCSNCGEQKSEIIPKIGHNFDEWKVSKEATIFEEGLEERVCLNCNKNEQNEIPKLESSVTISKSNLVLKIGKSQTIKILSQSNEDSIVSWKTSNKKIATVSKDGKVKALKKGKCSITVTMKSGCKAICKITVKK